MPPDNTARFSSVAENYARYRPGYPPEFLAFCRNTFGLIPGWAIADLGAGTGIFSAMLLDHGNTVYAVEPNTPMRQAAEARLAHHPRYRSVAAVAEATTLPDASVDLVTAATAFHWFDPAASRREALRILKPGGWAVVLWNVPDAAGSAISKAYQDVTEAHATNDPAAEWSRRNWQAALATFFGCADYIQWSTPNHQSLDWEALQGRALSASTAPAPDHPRHPLLLAGLHDFFLAHAQAGRVQVDYLVVAYALQLRPPIAA